MTLARRRRTAWQTPLLAPFLAIPMALAFTVTAAHASASGRADRADVGVGVDGDADADADKGEDVADAPFASVLTGGVALAEPGGQRGGTPGATTHGTTTAFVLAEAETRPLHLGLGWYGGVGISGGSMPVLAMVSSPSLCRSFSA